jgi:hypothetical protein
MQNDHGPSVKNDKQYEGLRKKGMSKARAEDREYAGSFEEGRQEVELVALDGINN